MSEQPIPKGPSLFIEVFCLGKEVQFGNIHAGRTDHIAKMTTDTEINPFVNRRFSGPSESFCSWTCLLRSREEGSYPGNGADSHAGGTADTNIIVGFGPGFLIFHIADLINLGCVTSTFLIPPGLPLAKGGERI
jgi:hypothetical protein